MSLEATTGPGAMARDLLHGLTDGRFVPGQRLAEPDLMLRYGVGRSTVREALAQLVGAGLAEHLPHKGVAIRRLTRREAADVLKVSAALLALTARQAAEAVADGADPAVLMAAAADLARAPTGRNRGRYYRALCALSGNREAMRLMPTIQVPLVRAQLASHLPDGMADRAALVAAVVAGNAPTAEAEARAWLERLLERLPALPQSAFAPG